MTNQWPLKIDKCMKAYLFNKCLQDLGICLSGSSGSFRFGLVGMFLLILSYSKSSNIQFISLLTTNCL